MYYTKQVSITQTPGSLQDHSETDNPRQKHTNKGTPNNSEHISYSSSLIPQTVSSTTPVNRYSRTKDDKKTRLRQNVGTKKSRKNNVQLSECTLSFFRMLSSYPDV